MLIEIFMQFHISSNLNIIIRMAQAIKFKIKRLKHSRESSIPCTLKNVVIEYRPKNSIYIGGLSKTTVERISDLLDTACLLTSFSTIGGYVIFNNRNKIVTITLDRHVKPCKPQ